MPGSNMPDGKKRNAYPVIVANQKESKAVSKKGRSSKNLHQKEKGSYSNKKRKLVEKGASSNYEYAESFDEFSDDEEVVHHEVDVSDVSRGEEQDIYEDNSADGDEPSIDSNDEQEFSDDNDEEGAEVQEEDDIDAEGDDEGESELDDDEEIENINAAANEKRTKQKKRTDPEAFSSAMTAILSSHLKAHDRKDPVLVRSKQTAKAIEESKLEAKARRELRLEKKQFLDKARIRDVITGIREGETPNPDAVQKNTERERKLKKTAKRGVVKLFNTVIEAQKKATDALAV
ncbi:Rrp15p-domain-containing protein [Lipomyces chichibuensis]|uniref:Rrp15p-domain-containing protein n=1 Tax=Lipomyces chichibuensis TaxID=1546026 RepID=UPI003343EF83